MTAVAAGAIDYDQVAEVSLACVEIANRVTPSQSWDDTVIDALYGCDGDISSAPSQTLIACGKAADAWQRGAN